MPKELINETPVQAGMERGEIPSRETVQQTVSPRSTVERATTNPRSRPKFGSSKLGVDCSKLIEAGFYCHWINDYPGRVQDALGSGYQFVKLSEIESSPTIGAPSADGEERVSRRVGVGEEGKPLLAYLMKIPSEWKKENDSFYQERCDAVDRQIRAGQAGVEKGYVPKGDAISYTSRNR